MGIESRPSDHPVDLDPPGSVTRFFEPVGELAAFAGDIALSGTRYGIAVGGFVAMSYTMHAAYFRISFSTLLSRQDIRDVVLSMGVGVLIGIIRAVRDERLGTGAVTVRSAYAMVKTRPDRED
ncbi:MAG: hypothetical protein B7Z58_13155 [Acidiphilium sp. 37-64-53]|uniref:hypothetical protein n=1 Tax=Acidiphilium TaxID=522 RepID=UPI000BD4EA70|nr:MULTISPECIES: hypothetical protein [Acidiphilium]OYW01024.1 MAG: hypothetical protein B7Z58_13155 [Acidiphilium sp. 37-64-53]HQT85035.1 hypothetical protein [Acidiphilium rubrum]